MSGKNPEKSCELLLSLPDGAEKYGREWLGFTRRWLKREPLKSAAFILKCEQSGAIPKFSEKDAMFWQASVAFSHLMSQPALGYQAVANTHDDLKDDVWQMALTLAPTKELHEQLLQSFLTALPATGIQKSDKREALTAGMRRWEHFHPMGNLEQWLHSLPTPPGQKAVILSTWATLPENMTHIAVNADQVLRSLSPDHQGVAAAELTRGWMEADFNAAGTWLNENKSAAWYDEAAAKFAGGIRTKDPAAAATWCLSLKDEAKRHAALNNMMPLWLNNSPTEAKAFLDQSTIPETWKKEWR